jgi:hypothetical protein
VLLGDFGNLATLLNPLNTRTLQYMHVHQNVMN